MLDSVLVDQQSLNLCGIESAPRLVRNEAGVSTQKTKGGLPVWTISCLSRREGLPPEILNVSVAAATAPPVQPLAPLVFTNLLARFWQMDGARAGLSFSADAVQAAPANKRGE
jgi:hypothetical protein